MSRDPIGPDHEALLRRVALAPGGVLAITTERLVDKFRAFALRERGLITTQGIGVVVATITPAGALEAKTTELLSTSRGRSWSNLRIPCSACRGVAPRPFEPACGFCRAGIAKMVCVDHDPPMALPGCGCFDGSDRAMGMRVAPRAELAPVPARPRRAIR